MVKTRQDVADAYAAREALATQGMETPLVAKLNAICDAHAGGKSRATLGLGVVGDHLVIGVQGGIDIQQEELLAEVSRACGLRLAHVHLASPGTLGLTEAGHHAEMLIIRFAVTVTDLAIPATVAQLGVGLGIATTKGCCIHCGTYLARHGIAHTNTSGRLSTGQARPQYAPIDGPGMGTWHHPFTGARWMQVVSGSKWEYWKGATQHHQD